MGQLGGASTTAPSNMLDDDDEILAASERAARAKKAQSAPSAWQSMLNTVREKATGKARVYEGDRVIHVNAAHLNAPSKFPGNSVSTSKYNIVTFVPKFFVEQFSRVANSFFLFAAAIQQIPGVSPTNRYTTIAPLALVLAVAAAKEAQEDIKRHQSDAELNARRVKVLVGSNFETEPWRQLKVGDIVRLESNDFFPADLVILSSSEPEGLCYIETSNLDGSVQPRFCRNSVY